MTRRVLHAAIRAFTLVELLVVISIFVLILAIGVPAFSSLLYTSDQSLAENALRLGMSGARDAAARSTTGQDAAAVFFYDEGRLTIVTCVKVGTTREPNPIGTASSFIEREVFAPVPGINPIQLPRFWMIRGYAQPARLTDTPVSGAPPEWYEVTHGGANLRTTHWLFPETSFFDINNGNDGDDRQTFMVRFEGATGRLWSGDPAAVLVFAPSPGTSFRTAAPWSNFRADREADPARFVRRVEAATMPIADRARLLGNLSSDTVLTKPVTQLAVYNERRLAGGIGGRVDDGTGCLYAPGVNPQYVAVAGLSAAQIPDAIDQWVENRLQGRESDARLFTVQRSLGWLQELTGSKVMP